MGPGLYGTQLLVHDQTTGLEMTMKKISSIFLCLVTNYPFLDSLETLILSHRQRRCQINSRVLKMFLGQIVDALAYLHKRNLIHKNVKPSNILLVDENHFRLCDSICCSLTTDRMKLSVKATAAMKCWMAPESVFEHRWSEKSDIWSLGCVLLDMLTCHVQDASSSVSQLLRLRQNQGPLEVILHPGLHKLLCLMVQCNPAKRATIWVLVNEDLVKAGLQQCGSALSYMKKILPHGVSGPPFDQGPDQVLVTSKLSEVMDVVTKAMQTHLDCVAVQLGACQVVSAALSADEESTHCVLPKELTSTVLAAVLTYPQHAQLLASALRLLGCPSALKQTAECMLEDSVFNEVLGALRRFPKQPEVVTSGCLCLQGLLATGVQGMSDHKDLEDCVLLLIHVLKKQQAHAEPNGRLVSNALKALSSLARTSELAAYRISVAPDGGRGLALIKEVIFCYRDDWKVMESVCGLLASLSQYGDIVVGIVKEQIPEELALIGERFGSNQEILEQITLALSRIKCTPICESTTG
ncbi:serine/threonine kinase-like domain-containing protein STKLD1 [Aplochiton taeniatus]